jgi:YfiH family protein
MIDSLTCLVYDELSHPALVHGTLVFRDARMTGDRSLWRGEVAGFLKAHLGVQPDAVIIPDQTHSAEVGLVGARDGDRALICDGLVTGEARVLIGVSTADCIPLFAVNMRDHTIGIAHCGWRGIASGMVEEFAEALGRRTGHPEETRYLLGAAIGPCCYEVGHDLLAHLGSDERRNHTRRAALHLDLKGLVAARLAARGARPEQIHVDNTCTACQKYELCSYRADGGDCGRMLSFVMLTK